MNDKVLTNGEIDTTPCSARKRPLGARVRRFCYRWCDQLKLAEFWCFVVAGVLISVACTYFFVKSEFTEQFLAMKEQTDARVAEVQDINIGLMTTLQEKITPLVETQAELSDKLDKTTDQVATAATRSNQAANVANQAATKADRAVRKTRQPAGNLRVVPNKRKEPRCFLGKDVYDQPCR